MGIAIAPRGKAECPQRIGPILKFAAGLRHRQEFILYSGCPPLILGNQALAEPGEDDNDGMDISLSAQPDQA